MNNTISRRPHSPIANKALLQILPLSCLLWGFSAASFMPRAVSQEQAEKQPIEEITAPEYLRNQDLFRKIRQEFGNRTNPVSLKEVEFTTYRLGSGDAIAVSVSPRAKDYSFNATLDWAGNISVPLVGILSLKDLTLKQAEDKIRTGLAEYLVNPQVGLVLTTARPVRVTITGEVVKPGFYPLQDARLPVALIEAGGTTRLADLRTVAVRRRSGNEAPQEQNFDLYTPLLQGSELPDLRLIDGDRISIPALSSNNGNEYNRNLIAGVNVAQKEITIRVLDYSSGVNRVRLPNGSDFLDAFTSIKPSLKDTNLRKVSLIRFDQAQGRAIEIKINARDALKGDSSQNPTLENNDVIVVDRNLISKINNFLNQVTQPFKDALGFLLFFDTAGGGINQVFGSGNDDR